MARVLWNEALRLHTCSRKSLGCEKAQDIVQCGGIGRDRALIGSVSSYAGHFDACWSSSCNSTYSTSVDNRTGTVLATSWWRGGRAGRWSASGMWARRRVRLRVRKWTECRLERDGCFKERCYRAGDQQSRAAQGPLVTSLNWGSMRANFQSLSPAGDFIKHYKKKTDQIQRTFPIPHPPPQANPFHPPLPPTPPLHPPPQASVAPLPSSAY